MAGSTATSITLAWNAATDNVGVAGYRLYRGTSVAGTTTTTRYTYTGLLCGTNYTLALEAYDAAGNRSNRAEATTTQRTAACTSLIIPQTATTSDALVVDSGLPTALKVCKKPTRKCPSTLTLKVDRPEGVAISARLTKPGSRAARLAGSRLRVMSRGATARIKVSARSLRRGRYRIQIVARSPGVGTSKPVFVRLTVR